ncbi:hypothetical protein AB4251_14455 [Vibrio lentus]|uniref:Uncharacterized protein n=1 Tax=Vibrio lentus TaxID=136468 RepID=A0AB36XQV1_9VIBR|nr:hypothetical protein [Vibrio lentus]MCC4835009.1 hypothetical protein [Vibrio lentus]PMI17419.1 hypothetical protein BCU51_01445 [Vibrio lentus]PMK48114.1 hypothetical protein BCT99_14690 [Vibrio lentus]PML30954.1 hypothetical protein BCT79_20095 [Vibrio lentus]PMM34053.1 hypothetical protein BCT56_10760 [Vibrio lentus]
MSFLSKCGQIIDVILGEYKLPTEKQHTIDGLSTVLCNYNTLDKEALNGCFLIYQEIQDVFSYIPEGRTVEAKTISHGTLILRKENGLMRVIRIE